MDCIINCTVHNGVHQCAIMPKLDSSTAKNNNVMMCHFVVYICLMAVGNTICCSPDMTYRAKLLLNIFNDDYY